MPNSGGPIGIDYPDGLVDEPIVVDVVFLSVGKFHDFALGVSRIDVDSPFPLSGADRDKIQGDVIAEVFGFSDVVVCSDVTEEGEGYSGS